MRPSALLIPPAVALATASICALAALSYNVNRALVVDVAASAGLSRHAPDWQLATGLTVQLGRWF